MKTQSSTH